MGKRGRELKREVQADSELILAYRRAIRLYVELSMTSRLRWRKRARLDAEVEAACADADRRIRELARPTAKPVALRRILDERDLPAMRDEVAGVG